MSTVLKFDQKPAAQVRNAAREAARKADYLLREAKLKVTQPRRSVLATLIRKHGPLTIDEIHHSLRRGECDRVTIYRSMTALEKAGLIARCAFGDGVARYEYGQSELSEHHHHLICSQCRAVESLDVCLDNDWKTILTEKGYTDVSHSLEFFGICPRCRRIS